MVGGAAAFGADSFNEQVIQGLRAEELAARTPWLVDACKAHGFRFSPRLHILIWGAKRGV